MKVLILKTPPELLPVVEIATFMRSTLEKLLDDAMGSSNTQGACLHAAMVLAESLERFGNVHAKVKGGGPPMDGGFYDTDGACHGHYWVEGITQSGVDFVADITADQFGLDKVLVLRTDEARHIYSPGQQSLVDGHVQDEKSHWHQTA